MSENHLRKQLIRLAHANPDLRSAILPLLKVGSTIKQRFVTEMVLTNLSVKTLVEGTSWEVTGKLEYNSAGNWENWEIFPIAFQAIVVGRASIGFESKSFDLIGPMNNNIAIKAIYSGCFETILQNNLAILEV